MARKHSAICPRCGSVETLPIQAGWPVPELGQKSPGRPGSKMERILGVDNPNRVCRKCGHQWRTGSKS